MRCGSFSELFRPDVQQEKFLPRLERLLAGAGLGERIRKEIEVANEQARLHQERVRTAHDPMETPSPSSGSTPQ